MGLGGCYSVLKFFLVIFNLIFWVVGIAGIVFGIWMLVEPTFSESLTQQYNDYVISLVIILVASILLVIVAGLGLYGTFKESQCALTTFFCLLLIIFVVEVAAGVWGYINRDSLELQVRNTVKETVQEEYGNNADRKQLFDTIQRNLQCCGAEKPQDWMGNNKLRVSVMADTSMYNIPESCCRPEISQDQCLGATRDIKLTSGLNYNVIFDKGCYSLIIEQLKYHGCLLMGIGIAVAAIQVLGLIFSLILAFAVNRSNRYKA